MVEIADKSQIHEMRCQFRYSTNGRPMQTQCLDFHMSFLSATGTLEGSDWRNRRRSRPITLCDHILSTRNYSRIDAARGRYRTWLNSSLDSSDDEELDLMELMREEAGISHTVQ